MKINLDFYKEKQEDLLPIEKEIIKYINENEVKDYNSIIEKNNRIEIVQTLSGMAENILNWYEFNSKATILQLGGNFGEITGMLCDKVAKVVVLEKSYEKAQSIAKRHKDKENLEIIVGELNEINLTEKFDYVVISGIFEYAPLFIKGENCFKELIKYASIQLKDNGKILLATENKFGISYWAGKKDLLKTNENRELTKKRKKDECQAFGERQLRKLFDELELKYHFYYIFPHYKIPNLIYSENYKLSKEDVSRNFMCYGEDEFINFSENEVLDRIIKEDKKMFNFFANSFFIEISKNELQSETKYVAFTNYRKKEYQTMTIIRENKVTKKAMCKEGQKHIDTIIKNLKHLKTYNVNVIENGINGQVVSEYIKGYSQLDAKLESAKNIEEFQKQFKPYIDMLYENAIDYKDIKSDEVKKVIQNYDKEKLEKMKFLEYGFIDLIPKNCFDVDGKIVVFDQEWMLKYIPVEYIIYRAIQNSNLIEKFSDKLYEIYNLLEHEELFKKLEEEFRVNVIDEIILYKVFYKHIKTKQEIMDTLQHYKNLKGIAESEKARLENENRVMQNEINELRETLNGIINSKSWKITKPLRKITQIGRKKE